MSVDVAILGGGVAACCTARLLASRGYRFSCDRETRLTGPTLLINQSTCQLLADVFPDAGAAVRDGIVIRHRLVSWGQDTEPVHLPHYGIALHEPELLKRLWEQVDEPSAAMSPAPPWTVSCSWSDMPSARFTFGTREAQAIRVTLSDGEHDTCWVESLDTGWLFLLPSTGAGAAVLLATGAEPDVLLAESRLIAPLVDRLVDPAPARFSTSPGILYPPCGIGWLACGSDAMSLDPICGEGAGNSVREAILATAVIAAGERGVSALTLLAHYTARLLAGFVRHLNVSRNFYALGGTGDWWRLQVRDIDRGLAWATHELSLLPAPQYRLRDFELEPLPKPVRLQ
jgi:flavin-dependent dehydrogenase